jgi:hypothetical protein
MLRVRDKATTSFMERNETDVLDAINASIPNSLQTYLMVRNVGILEAKPA